MVLKILPDARQRRLHFDAVGGQRLRLADPESIRICGELIAPAETITSRSARATWRCPSLTILDADGAHPFKVSAPRGPAP